MLLHYVHYMDATAQKLPGNQLSLLHEPEQTLGQTSPGVKTVQLSSHCEADRNQVSN